MKTVFLVAHWQPGRGQTQDRPACWFGPSNYIINSLDDADPAKCYKSESAALRQAAKWFSRYSRTAVVEVKGE